MNTHTRTAYALIIAAIIFVLFGASVQAAEAGDSNDAGRVRFLVKWRAEVGIAAQPAATYQVDTYQTWPLDWQIVEVDAIHANELMADLSADPRVASFTPDYSLEIAAEPDDPAFRDGSQWALGKVGADIAWEFSQGQAITVAIVDSGIDGTHPDLAGQLVEGYDFYSESTDTSDPCGHGTHVAGIVAAAANNGIGIAGLAHQAKLMPVKVISDACTGTYSRLILGILYAVDNGARVIVITSGATYEHVGLRDAIQYARDHNVIVVAAAGNRGTDVPFYPGSYEEAFTVAGTNNDDGRYVSSTYGTQIDVSAPATTIYSTYYKPDTGSTYAYMTGTSMAAPHVGALAALILAVDPTIALEDLEMVLRQTADDLGESGWDQHFGWGRINAWRALAAVSPAAGNVKLGNTRIPVMAAFAGENITATSEAAGVKLAWEMSQGNADHAIVVYRSTVPVFESAQDVAEAPLVAASANGNHVIDTQVASGQTYYYWLVQSDRTVEIAVSQMVSVTYEKPETPGNDPGTPVSHSTFLPMTRGS